MPDNLVEVTQIWNLEDGQDVTTAVMTQAEWTEYKGLLEKENREGPLDLIDPDLQERSETLCNLHRRGKVSTRIKVRYNPSSIDIGV